MPSPAIPDSGFLSEEAFVRRFHLEQRRTERSRRPFIFMLLASASLFKTGQKHGVCDQILNVLSKSIRETDIKGWYENGSAVGVIFTEIGPTDGRSIGDALVAKFRRLLESKLTAHQVSQIDLTFYLFPEDWDKECNSMPAVLYPDSVRSRRPSQLVKRCIDIAGSLAALILASPLYMAIAVAIKLTSNGPVFFHQKRVGQYGCKFTFLKFRSMYVNNDAAIHEEYVKGLIAGSTKSAHKGGLQNNVYKLTNDPRITAVGRFLRKTSLDEIPQFLNVLKGEMSLVGPRPPIPYEVEVYDIWHRRRLLGVKPGITGLWQVYGRSRTTFDEMVRLDLQYAQSWSVWLDLKILLQTPRVVIDGDGAY
jgi:lipopolysaccharide/colanic/teichoic acid biosynthesis glycosyltransferase